MKVTFHYDDDPEPWISYALFDSNAAIIDAVREFLDPSSPHKYFEKEYCIDSSLGCNVLAIQELGKWNYATGDNFDHYSFQVLLNEKDVIKEGRTDVIQFIKFGKCSSPACAPGLVQLNIKMAGEVNDTPQSALFKYTIFHNNGTIIEKQTNDFDPGIEGLKYSEKSVCLDPSGCYTVWISSEVFYEVEFDGTVVGIGRSGLDTSVINAGKEHCGDICDSKPLLIDSVSSSNFQFSRSHDIMAVLMTISGIETFRDINSAQYQAACWIIYDDPYQVSAFDKSLVQRYILALLYYSTNGRGWLRKFSFLSPISECNWTYYNRQYDSFIGESYYKLYGASCNENGSVMMLNLQQKELKGTIVSEISKLKYLEHMHLGWNKIEGTLPEEIGQLINLKEVLLQGNQLSGALPESLFQIQTMEMLVLHENMFSGTLPRGTASLTSFKEFSLMNNILSGTLPEDLYNATALETIQIAGNLFSGEIPQENFVKMTSLRVIDLSNNNFKGPIPPQLSNITSLEEIQLSNNSLMGAIPSELGYLSSLKLLDLSHNMLNGEIPLSFINLSSLKNLHIYNNNIRGNVSEELCHYFENLTTYSFKADCADEQIEAQVNCTCCTECFSRYSFLEHFGKCHGVELKIEMDYDASNTVGKSWFVKDNWGKAILQDGPYSSISPLHSMYTACISETGCYTMYAMDLLEFEILMRNKSIHYKYWSQQDATIHFGYSSNSEYFAVDKCDNIMVYQDNAPQNSTRRNIFDRLAQISGLDLINTSVTSPQYKSAEWSINDNVGTKELKLIRIIQRYILGVFYYSTGGEYWLNEESWMDETHECHWYGITCHDDDIVIGLNLAQNNLTGSLPFEIGELTSLQNMSLPHNKLTNSIPIEIGNLYSLKRLDLGSNSITGTIPTSIGALEQLEVLNLSNNTINGMIPAEIGHDFNLTLLDFSNNSLTGTLPLAFYDLAALKKLDLHINFLHGSIENNKLLSFAALTYLDLSMNSFTGTLLKSISNLIDLQVLNVAQNNFEGNIPSEIGNLTELLTLMLYNNEFTGSLPSEISKLEKVVNVSLSYNFLRGTIPKEIGTLGSIKLLHLHGNRLFGNANYFKKDQLDQYITDCGSILGSPAEVTCPYCTQCCNAEGNCLSLDNTWPKTTTIERFENVYGNAGAFVIAILLTLCIVIFVVSPLLMKIVKKVWRDPFMFETPARDQFAEKSVYRFFLSNNSIGWSIGLVTVLMQIFIFYIFLNASDFTSTSNEWEYSEECSGDGCIDRKTRTYFGWFMVLFAVVVFLLRDLVNSIKLFYESIVVSDFRCLFASVALFFVTILAIVTSIIINYATGLTNAQILKDSVVLLFLSDIDEKLFYGLQAMFPEWISNLDDDNNSTLENLVMNTQQNVTMLQSGQSQMDIELKQIKDIVFDLQKRYSQIQNKCGNVENECEDVMAKNECEDLMAKNECEDLMAKNECEDVMAKNEYEDVNARKEYKQGCKDVKPKQECDDEKAENE